MKKPKTHDPLKSGRVISERETDIESQEINHEEFELSTIKRLRGRPRLGSEPSFIVPVRLSADLIDELDRQVIDSGQTRSEVIRRALKYYLAS